MFSGPVPRVSIVIPAYNRERYVGLTLGSIQAQSLNAWEAVVFDDGSRDATAEVARRHAQTDPRIRVVGGANGGVAAARNRGYAATDPRSEFVIFLDSDDLWEPDTLETLVAVLDAHPEYSSSHGVARCIDSEGEPLPGDDLEERSRARKGYRNSGLMDIDPDEPTTFAELAYHNWILTPGTHLIRRSVLDAVGSFDPETDPGDDWDMAIRVSRHGAIGYVDRPLLLWRRHGDTLTQTSPHWRRAYFRVRDKMLADPDNTDEQAKVARVAYLALCRSSWSNGRRMIARRQLSAGLRECARGAEATARYVRAVARRSLMARSRST